MSGDRCAGIREDSLVGALQVADVLGVGRATLEWYVARRLDLVVDCRAQGLDHRVGRFEPVLVLVWDVAERAAHDAALDRAQPHPVAVGEGVVVERPVGAQGSVVARREPERGEALQPEASDDEPVGTLVEGEWRRIDEVGVVRLDGCVDPDVVLESEDNARGGGVVGGSEGPVVVEPPQHRAGPVGDGQPILEQSELQPLRLSQRGGHRSSPSWTWDHGRCASTLPAAIGGRSEPRSLVSSGHDRASDRGHRDGLGSLSSCFGGREPGVCRCFGDPVPPKRARWLYGSGDRPGDSPDHRSVRALGPVVQERPAMAAPCRHRPRNPQRHRRHGCSPWTDTFVRTIAPRASRISTGLPRCASRPKFCEWCRRRSPSRTGVSSATVARRWPTL